MEDRTTGRTQATNTEVMEQKWQGSYRNGRLFKRRALGPGALGSWQEEDQSKQQLRPRSGPAAQPALQSTTAVALGL